MMDFLNNTFTVWDNPRNHIKTSYCIPLPQTTLTERSINQSGDREAEKRKQDAQLVFMHLRFAACFPLYTLTFFPSSSYWPVACVAFRPPDREAHARGREGNKQACMAWKLKHVYESFFNFTISIHSSPIDLRNKKMKKKYKTLLLTISYSNGVSEMCFEIRLSLLREMSLICYQSKDSD